MAKKSKPQKQPEEQTGKPQTGKPTSMSSGLMSILAPALFGCTLITAAVGILLMFMVIQPVSQQQMQNFNRAMAERYLQDLEQLGNNYQNKVDDLANSGFVKQALRSALKPQQLRQQMADLFSSSSNIQLFSYGRAKKDSNTTPPISFAQLDMVATAERKNDAIPEVHVHDNKAYLTIVRAVIDGEKVLGTLLVSFDLETLRKQIPKLDPSLGYVELIQTFAKKSNVIYQSGQASHKQGPGTEAKGAIPHWSARFYPAAELDVGARHSSLAWILIGVGAVLSLLCGILSFILLTKALKANATTLASHFQALFSKDKSSKKFTLGIFASIEQTLLHLFRDYDRKPSKPPAKTKPSRANKASSNLPDFDPTNDDVLDVDIHEDDSALLSGASAQDDNPLDLDSLEELDQMELAEPDTVTIDVDVDPGIFRAYDIRGVVGQSLDRDVAYAIGAAIGSEAKDANQESIIVARDGRHSSPELAEALASGVQATGVNVIDIGQVPTPVLYYAAKTLPTQSGVMVTGSHNPPDYNGFKIVIADETLAQERIQRLLQRIQQGQLHSGEGSYQAQDISADYMERICSDVVLAKPMRIVMDAGNGVAGPIAAKLLDALGCMVTPLYAEVDGNFPNHHPDPSNPDNLQDLINAVQAEDAELGVAFDGDGDRLGIVTRSGKIIWPDRMLMLYARDLLSRNPGADILYDVKCSRDVAEIVSSLGGRAIMCPTGHSLVKAKMKETGAVVGGEFSGHIFFNDRWYGFDDALYSAARLLEILSMEPFTPDEVFAEIPEKLNTPELHIKVTEDSKFRIMEKMKASAQFEGGNMVTVDGVRVDFPDSWGLLRASNTTPVLVARFEGDSEAALEQAQRVFREQLLALEPGLSIPF